jgi:glyoxylase-like metal-dependent hydrolase (beta-lactamase superfamily II)
MKEIAPNIYVSTEYPGVNVGLIVMPEGAIAVDAPTLPQDARAWRQKVAEIAQVPLQYVVLTDAHPDRSLSAGILTGSEDGPGGGPERVPIVATRDVFDRASAYTDGFWRGIVEGWSRRHPEAADELLGRQGALPEIVFTRSITLLKGGKPVTVKQVAGATQGSAWIRLTEQNVLFTGDVLVVDSPPLLAATPNSKAWMDTLTAMRRVSFAETTIVPGRGPVCDQSATHLLSEYIALVRRRVRSLHTSGQPRADIAAIVIELMDFLSIPEHEYDWVQRYIKAGVDRLYEELRSE